MCMSKYVFTSVCMYVCECVWGGEKERESEREREERRLGKSAGQTA